MLPIFDILKHTNSLGLTSHCLSYHDDSGAGANHFIQIEKRSEVGWLRLQSSSLQSIEQLETKVFRVRMLMLRLDKYVLCHRLEHNNVIGLKLGYVLIKD